MNYPSWACFTYFVGGGSRKCHYKIGCFTPSTVNGKFLLARIVQWRLTSFNSSPTRLAVRLRLLTETPEQLSGRLLRRHDKCVLPPLAWWLIPPAAPNIFWGTSRVSNKPRNASSQPLIDFNMSDSGSSVYFGVWSNWSTNEIPFMICFPETQADKHA